MSASRAPLPRRSYTLATKFLLIVVLGVLVPLAVVGVWLTRSSERSGRELLSGQLDNAIDAMATRAFERWTLRSGDLLLLANNSVAKTAVGAAPLTSADSTYLFQLTRALAPAIAAVSYRDASGVERWGSMALVDSTRDRVIGRVIGSSSSEFVVARPVGITPTASGTMTARVRLPSVVPVDSAAVVAPGAAWLVADTSGVIWSSAPDSLDLHGGAPSGWMLVQRQLREPPLTVMLAAPTAPFVKPFERAARTGLAVLAVVALIALLLSIVLTSRVTRSLERLVVAATAVAQGNLELTVDTPEDDEVGRLAAAFNAMTESLRRTLADLSQQRSLAAVGEFAATLSHEVRNALTAIRIDLQHATRHAPSPEPAAALVTRALDSVRQLDATVTSALRVAREGHVPRMPVKIDDVLERALRTAAPSFTDRRCTVSAPAAMSHATVLGDAAALEQLFVNLLLNASQAMTAAGSARVTVEECDAAVTVAIHDDGIGFPAGAIPDIGQPFHSSKPYGTGLGLSIAKRITEAHGGTLVATSTPGDGATVSVRLPMLKSASHAPLSA